MREASVMLIIKDGLILGISRRDDKTKFGLPGGKLEIGELPKAAAIRETKEETSVIVNDCIKIFLREEPPMLPGGKSFYTHCYYAITWEGEPQNSEEGIVKWLTYKELTSSLGAFPDYNKKTIEVFKQKYPNIELVGE